jgi:hypothetical protein
LLFLFGCATTVPLVPEITAVPSIQAFQPRWQQVFQGIDLARALKMGRDPQVAYAARIDLRASGIRFMVTPSNGDKPAETDGQTTGDFLQANHCQLAINASPFSPVKEEPGSPKDILGLSVSRGDAYSNAKEGHGALLISKDNKALIAEPPYNIENVYNAVGGFGMLLQDGVCVVAGTDNVRHPRTAAGLSPDGRFLYLLAIDGRQPGYSVGATTKETADWLRQLGAVSAVNLDGGGSTCMAMDDGAGGIDVLNRPIHNNIPGNQRVNGNSLGVFAKPRK